jgi:hypothetical protein
MPTQPGTIGMAPGGAPGMAPAMMMGGQAPGGAPGQAPGGAPGPGAQAPRRSGQPADRCRQTGFSPFAFGGAFGPKNVPSDELRRRQRPERRQRRRTARHQAARRRRGARQRRGAHRRRGGMQKAGHGGRQASAPRVSGGVSGHVSATRATRSAAVSPLRSGLCPGPATASSAARRATSSGVTQEPERQHSASRHAGRPSLRSHVFRELCCLRSLARQGPFFVCVGARAAAAAFQGKTVTVNSDFADEVIRLDAHARNAGIKLYITGATP